MENPNEKKPPFKQNPFLTFAIFVILTLLLFKLFSPNGDSFTERLMGGNITKEISYNELKELITRGEISAVNIGQTYIKAYSANTSPRILYTTKKVADLGLVPLLDEKKIEYSGFSEGSFLGDLVNMLLPIFIILALWMFLTARMQKSMGGGIFGMGNAKKLVNAEKPNVRFDDMAGNAEAKEEVVEIVDFLKYPERYAAVGAKIPRGVLLVGYKWFNN